MTGLPDRLGLEKGPSSCLPLSRWLSQTPCQWLLRGGGHPGVRSRCIGYHAILQPHEASPLLMKSLGRNMGTGPQGVRI